MKLNMLAVLAVVSATGSLMSMEQNNNNVRLNFLLGHNWRIKGYSAENYTLSPDKFVGKKFIESGSSEDDRKTISAGLESAAQQQKTITVSYTLDNKEFFATITPLIRMEKGKDGYLKTTNNFSVRVTPYQVAELSLPKDEPR